MKSDKEIKEFYRGESKVYDKPCMPSIKRFIKQSDESLVLEKDYYKNSVSYLKKIQILNYDDKDFLSQIKELSYLQHYGFGTRLLDITDTYDIALYFACFGDFKDDGVIYLIKDIEQRMSGDVKSVERKLECINKAEILINRNIKKYYEVNFKEKIQLNTISDNIILDYCKIFKTEEKNIRYKRQNGYFILFGNIITDSILTNDLTLLDMSFFGNKIIKSNEKIKKLYNLSKTNIFYTYLFPDDSLSYKIKSAFDKIEIVDDKIKFLKKFIADEYGVDENIIKNTGLINELILDYKLFSFFMVELKKYVKETKSDTCFLKEKNLKIKDIIYSYKGE